jgi:3-dehydroquinate dehydratase-2
MNIQIINGPNLNLLGVREKSIYGSADFESYLAELQQHFTNITINYYQSNVEVEIINKLHEVGFTCNGIVLNAGAYTHTSVAIGDAIAAISTPTIEVHISNVYKREEFRHHSMLAANCKGVIAGFGMHSYRLAIESLLLTY